jgi:hypothetical protein
MAAVAHTVEEVDRKAAVAAAAVVVAVVRTAVADHTEVVAPLAEAPLPAGIAVTSRINPFCPRTD